MIKYAIFAGDEQQYRLWLQDNPEVSPEEAKYIRSEQDIHGLRDVEIIMYGTYYERGQEYTELADLLERNQSGKGTYRGTAASEIVGGGAKENNDAGESSENDLSNAPEGGQREQGNRELDDPSTTQRPNLPRRKSNAAQAKANGTAGLVEIISYEPVEAKQGDEIDLTLKSSGETVKAVLQQFNEGTGVIEVSFSSDELSKRFEETMFKLDRADQMTVEGGIRYWKDGDQWCAAHDATFVDIQESKVGFGPTKEAALKAFQAKAKGE